MSLRGGVKLLAVAREALGSESRLETYVAMVLGALGLVVLYREYVAAKRTFKSGA